MEEHFNENYLESEKYPKAQFNGKIKDFKEVKIDQPGTYPVRVSGTLTIHGKSRNVSTEGSFEVLKDGLLKGLSVFKISIADYGIKIPKIVTKKIAEEVDVTCELIYRIYDK